MIAPLLKRFEIREAVDTAARNDVYRFRYRIYVEQMGRRQKYADHVRKLIVEPLDEAARIYAAYLDGIIVGTIRGNRFSDLATGYYRKIYRIDDRFPLSPDQMSLTTKLMFDPGLQRSLYPIRLIVHYARDFNSGRLCKIDFVDCSRWLLPFFLKLEHMLKDVRLCLEEGQAAGAPFAFAALTREILTAAMGRGLGEDDFVALIEVLEATAGVRL